MTLEWLGHACFLLMSRDGHRIVTDPYEPGAYEAIHYDPVDVEADLVTVSHEHLDHNAVREVRGSPGIVWGAGRLEAGDVDITGIATYHDAEGGKLRGPNTMFAIGLDGIRVLHTGDLGHLPEEDVLRGWLGIDVLLVCVGGRSTIGPRDAVTLCQRLQPRVVVPMHYRTAKVSLPFAPVEEFLALWEGSVKVSGRKIAVTADETVERGIHVLSYGR